MKATKWIVFVLVAFLLASSFVTVNPTKAANPNSTDWIPDQKVSSTTNDELHPSITTAGDGSLWVAYEQFNTYRYVIVVAKSTDGGVTWTVTDTISSAYNLRSPSIAVDPYNNNVYVAYEYAVDIFVDCQIHLTIHNSTGWYTTTVDSPNHSDHNPSVVCEYEYNSNNFVFVTWERNVDRNVNSHDDELMFSRSTDHGNTWMNEIALTYHGIGELTTQPSMTYAGGNRIYIAYTDYNTTSGMHKIGLLKSVNEGASFGTSQDLTSYDTHDVTEPSITAVQGGTTVMAAWTYTFSGTDDDIDYSYSQDYGGTWSGVYNLAASTANEIAPHLTVDGMGRQGGYLGYIHAMYEKIETSGSRTNGIYYTKAYYSTPTSWSTPVQVADDNTNVSSTYPDVADRAITTVHDTVPVVVWTDARNPDLDVYTTTLGGKYTIDAVPSGLQVSADGTTYTAPVSFYWAYQSAHTLSASSQGIQTFQSWSDGGPITHTVTANTFDKQVITAYFANTGYAYLVVRGRDNRIYYSDTSPQWAALPSGTTIDGPAATIVGNTLHIVVRSSDGASLWYSNVNLITQAFSGWTLLSGSTPSTPTLTSNGTALALVVRGNDDRIYYRFYAITSQTWTGWAVLPSGSTIDSPAAALVYNTLHVVVKGSDGNSLWYCYVNPTTKAFSGWTPLSGSTPSIPTLTYNATALSLVVRGQNNLIYYCFCTLSSQTWSGWSALPSGTTPQSPAATIFGNYFFTVVVGSDNASLWLSVLSLSTNDFSGWSQLSGSTPSKPVLTS